MNMMSSKELGFADLLKNGQTLKEFRDGILERTARTGHYNGRRRLELREKDPIRYEKMFSKLRGGLVHARETAKKIAASPIVEQEGELCFTLYNAAGDWVLTSICNLPPWHIATIVLIFSSGKLVGWVGGVTHVIDTGAVTPGSMSTGQVQR